MERQTLCFVERKNKNKLKTNLSAAISADYPAESVFYISRHSYKGDIFVTT